MGGGWERFEKEKMGVVKERAKERQTDREEGTVVVEKQLFLLSPGSCCLMN